MTVADADLIAFVSARLGEDEAAARLAAREGGTWKQDHPGSGAAISSLGGTVVYDEGSPDEYQAAHIARHNPARALREVAFKQAILGQYRTAAGWSSDNWPLSLRLLAAIWSDHPDYRQEWAPLG